MLIRTTQPIHVFYFEVETTLLDMMQYVRIKAKQLYQDAIRNDLEITGPVYWIYKGADGQPETPFTLTIALPIAEKTATIIDSPFKVKTLDTFRFVSQIHTGAWNKLGETYCLIFAEIALTEPALSGETREVYINMDFENLEGNVTEVQIGLI